MSSTTFSRIHRGMNLPEGFLIEQRVLVSDRLENVTVYENK
jgi:hypothetical protein